jgi:hypothetical protein
MGGYIQLFSSGTGLIKRLFGGGAPQPWGWGSGIVHYGIPGGGVSALLKYFFLLGPPNYNPGLRSTLCERAKRITGGPSPKLIPKNKKSEIDQLRKQMLQRYTQVVLHANNIIRKKIIGSAPFFLRSAFERKVPTKIKFQFQQ